jgi:tetratricopeptide (TPR) repeat protein
MAEQAADFDQDYSTAVRYYSEAISYGDYWAFLTGRGECLVRLKDYSKAVVDLDRSNLLSPQKFRTLKSRGTAYYYLGERDKAKADFQMANVLDPSNDYVQKWIQFLNAQM